MWSCLKAVQSAFAIVIVALISLGGCAPSSVLTQTASLPAEPTQSALTAHYCPDGTVAEKKATGAGSTCHTKFAKRTEGDIGGNHAVEAAYDLMIEFDNDDAPVSARDRKALAAALDFNVKLGRRHVVIHAARGGDGNIFERAIVAERRARLVNQLLPPRMIKSVEFDPQQADDTVRIQFLQ